MKKDPFEILENYMNYMKKDWSNIILVMILIAGICLMAYPTFSDYWNSFHQTQAIAAYADQVSDMTEEEYEVILDKAAAYNQKLAKTGIIWNLSDEGKAEYTETLDITGTGIMGYLSIEKINCNLPIYHGTSEGALQVAVGHIEGTSLPVGGEGSHCVLSGHRGLPTAKLFTDLDQMEIGDTFELHVLSETYTYAVDNILITEPDNVGTLKIEEGEDYCTLVTCTPYGVNTHRLLVRGRRISNESTVNMAHVTADGLQIESVIIAPLVAIPVLLILLIWMLIETRQRKKGGKIKDELRKTYLSGQK